MGLSRSSTCHLWLVRIISILICRFCRQVEEDVHMRALRQVNQGRSAAGVAMVLSRSKIVY